MMDRGQSRIEPSEEEGGFTGFALAMFFVTYLTIHLMTVIRTRDFES